MKRFALGALAAFLIAACGSAAPSSSGTGKPEKTTVEMAVGGVSQFIYMPLTLAQQLGYYKDEGLTVHVTDFQGGSQAANAMVAGQADVTTGFYEHTIRFQVQGKELKMFATFDRYPGLVLLVAKNHAADVHSITDLKGHVVGVTAKGSSTDEMVKFLSKKAGLKPDDVPVKNVGTGSSAIAALKNPGDMWAEVTVDPAASQAVTQGLGTVLYDTRSSQGTKTVFGGDWPAGGFYTTSTFIKSNPNTVAALARATVKTLRWIHSHNADQIADKMPADYYGGDKAGYAASLKANLPMFTDAGAMPSDGPPIVLQSLGLVDSSITPDKVDLKKTYDNTYVDKAK